MEAKGNLYCLLMSLSMFTSCSGLVTIRDKERWNSKTGQDNEKYQNKRRHQKDNFSKLYLNDDKELCVGAFYQEGVLFYDYSKHDEPVDFDYSTIYRVKKKALIINDRSQSKFIRKSNKKWEYINRHMYHSLIKSKATICFNKEGKLRKYKYSTHHKLPKGHK